MTCGIFVSFHGLFDYPNKIIGFGILVKACANEHVPNRKAFTSIGKLGPRQEIGKHFHVHWEAVFNGIYLGKSQDSPRIAVSERMDSPQTCESECKFFCTLPLGKSVPPDGVEVIQSLLQLGFDVFWNCVREG